MALFLAQIFSDCLNMSTTVNVILPDQMPENGKLPKVLYLFHGYRNDYSTWQKNTAIERYASAYQLAVVMPCAGHSIYCNMNHGQRYWDYLSEELPEKMHQFFHISTCAEDCYAAGLSIGGYGAVKLALQHPERFAAVGSFSGLLDIVNYKTVTSERLLTSIENAIDSPDDIKDTENDLFYLLRKNAAAALKPKLYISCGTQDVFHNCHNPFVTEAKKNGWNVADYEKADGKHEWPFWDREIQCFLSWIFEENKGC